MHGCKKQHNKKQQQRNKQEPHTVELSAQVNADHQPLFKPINRSQKTFFFLTHDHSSLKLPESVTSFSFVFSVFFFLLIQAEENSYVNAPFHLFSLSLLKF